MPPEGGIHHSPALQDFLPRKVNERVVEIAVVSRIKAHAIGPRHHMIFDHFHHIGVPHTVPDSEPCHTENF